MRATLAVLVSITLTGALVVTPTARAATIAGVPLPGGARAHESGAYQSSKGFRDTVRFYQRHLDRRGTAYQLVPVYAYRGVDIARFLSSDENTPWRAIHVFRHQGRTFIHVVERGTQTPLTPTAPPG